MVVKSTTVADVAHPGINAAGLVSQIAALSGCRTQASWQRSVDLVLVTSDILLALPLCIVASSLQS